MPSALFGRTVRQQQPKAQQQHPTYHQALEVCTPAPSTAVVGAPGFHDTESDGPEPGSLHGALLEGEPPDGPPGSTHGSSASTTTPAQALPRRTRALMVFLFTAITALLSADQNLLAPNLTAAAEDFGLDSRGKDVVLGGYLMAAFFLVGAPSALICGWLADKTNRIRTLFIVIILGEAPCLATYWVTTLWQFFLLRMLTGIAVGGSFPLVFSLLGDLYPSSARAGMSAAVQIATGLGIGGGQMMAGLLGPATNWRLPFVVVSAPTIALGIYMVLAVPEPARGVCEPGLQHQLAEGETYSETVSWAKVRLLLRVPSNWLIITQGLPGCLPWGVMQTYLNDYLSQEKGFSVQTATVVILVFGLTGGAGVIAGGWAGQWMYNRRKSAVAIFSGVSVILGIGPVLAIVNGDLQAWGLAATCALAGVAGFLVSIAGPNIRAMTLNVNSPETRGVAIALQSVTDDLGRGLGPVVVAGFISTMGRQAAFNLSILAWGPCGLIIMLLACYLARDEAHLQGYLANRSEAMLASKRRTGSPEDTGGVTPGDAGDGGTALASSTAVGSGGGKVRVRNNLLARRGTDPLQAEGGAAAAGGGGGGGRGGVKVARASASWPGCNRGGGSTSTSTSSGSGGPYGEEFNSHMGHTNGQHLLVPGQRAAAELPAAAVPLLGAAAGGRHHYDAAACAADGLNSNLNLNSPMASSRGGGGGGLGGQGSGSGWPLRSSGSSDGTNASRKSSGTASNKPSRWGSNGSSSSPRGVLSPRAAAAAAAIGRPFAAVARLVSEHSGEAAGSEGDAALGQQIAAAQRGVGDVEACRPLLDGDGEEPLQR